MFRKVHALDVVMSVDFFPLASPLGLPPPPLLIAIILVV